MDTENGKKIAFVQIVGLVARRIICDVDIGNSMLGLGLIRFEVELIFIFHLMLYYGFKGQKW